MFGPVGLLQYLGPALGGAFRLSPCTAVTTSLSAQLRCFSAAAASHGAVASDIVRHSAPAEVSTARDTNTANGAGNPSTTSEDGSSSSSAGNRNDSGAAFNVDFRRVVSDRRTADRVGLEGIVHIQNTFNNIILTLTDQQGFIKTYTSAGIVGFKGARRSQPVAAERAAEELARRALTLGYGSVAVRLKGPGNTKQYAVQSLAAAGLQIKSLADVTPIPYNGCRLPKRRRV